MGCVNRLMYSFGSPYVYGGFRNHKEVYTHYKWVKDEIIEECQLDNPPLKEDEKIFIDSIGETVIVVEVVRSTSGGYIYYTDYVIKEVEDEETEASKQKSEKAELEWKEYLKRRKEEESQKENKKSWWKRLFG